MTTLQIETAPKNGTEIVLVWAPNWPTVDHEARTYWDKLRGKWAGDYTCATHWRPIRDWLQKPYNA